MDSSLPIVSHHNEDGFVLVAVIWIAGLLAVISTAFVLTVRSHTLLARNTVFNTKAEYVANGMAKLLALKLATETTDASLDRSGATTFCQWSADISVAWRIQDQAGLVDLNTASPQLMAALFRGIGLQETAIDDFTDFRDADTFALAGGTEPLTYEGKSFGPKNAPFALPAEIDQLPTVNEQIFKQLLPLVTVQSQQVGFDPAVAPTQLLNLLGAAGRNDPLLNTFSSPSAHKTYSIYVLVQTKQKARFLREAVVTLLLQPDRPYANQFWGRGQNGEGWTFPNEILEPCFN